MGESVQVKPGQRWSWDEPGGRRREMIVTRIGFFFGGLNRRAYGVHPRTRRPLQVSAVALERGERGARLEQDAPGEEESLKSG